MNHSNFSDNAVHAFSEARAQRFAAPLLCLLALLASLPAIGDWCVLSPDSFAYLDTARTIRETGHLPECAMMRPPGYPLALAPLLSLGDIPFMAVRLLNAFCLCVSALLTCALFRRDLGNRGAWIVAALVASSPALLRQQIVLLSEPLFTPLSLGALLVLSEWWRSRTTTWRSVALAGVLVAAASLCRSTGLILLPLSILVLLRALMMKRAREWLRVCLFGLLAIGPIAAYQMHQRAYASTHSYSHMWLHARSAENTNATGVSLQAERLGRFGPQRLADVAEAILPTALGWRLFSPPLARPTAWLIGGACLLVAGVRLLRSPSVVDAYFLLSMGMLALWPWDEGVRLVSPLTPLLFGYAVWTMLKLWDFGLCDRHRVCRGLLVTAFAVACVVQVMELAITQSRLRDRGRKEAARYADMQTLAGWLQTHTSAGESWIGVAWDGDPTKVLLLGGAYLSRTSITTVDVSPGESYRHTPNGERPTIIQNGIASGSTQDCAIIPTLQYGPLIARAFTDK